MNSSAAVTTIRLVRESFRVTQLCNVFRPFSRAGSCSARHVPLRAPCGLKWVGAITAVVSLLLGVQQLTSRIRDSLQRNRETTTLIEVARGQASRLEFRD